MTAVASAGIWYFWSYSNWTRTPSPRGSIRVTCPTLTPRILTSLCS